MPLTYQALKTLVQTYTENTATTFVADIDTFIDLAEKRTYNSVVLPVERKQNTALTTTSGNQYMTMPTDFLAPLSIAIIAPVTGTRTYLLNKDVEFIDAAYPTPGTTGTPAHYAFFSQTVSAQTIILGPTPDAAYATDIQYYFYPESLVTDTAGTWLSNNYPQVLLYGCLREAAVYMKSEPDMIANYEKLYQEGLEQLRQMGEGKDRRDAYRTRLTRVPAA